ncbi:hypothetical protein [Streptomyces sp. NPDC058861]|uniref:hypothetical protein n=1 Tax=Streptomyces sp. NPDC058861 TaxID=3346653 RepID=UPI0036913530
MALFTGDVPNGSAASTGPWLQRASGGAEFDGAEFVGSYAVLRWRTGLGGLALAHSMVDGNASPALVLKALRQAHGPQLADRYACVVVAQTSTQVHAPYVPELHVLDVDGSGAKYDTTWARLKAVLGQPAPYWYHALRDRDAIASWRPGSPPALVPAHDIATPVTDLAELAADEPDGSPAAELCQYLAREVRRRATASTGRYIEQLRKNAAEGGDGAHLVLGAVPAPLRRLAPQEPEEVVRRAGWLAITERRDVLAHRVAAFSLRWDGGRDWHTGAVTRVRPDACTAARAWATRLEPAAGSRAPTVLEKVLLGQADEQGVLLLDPATGVPALRSVSDSSVWAYALQRLPSHSPLAEVILSQGICWIRTEDQALWLAPERSDHGIGYGYSGTGSRALARLIDTLLNDISSPAADAGDPDAPDGLLRLVTAAPPHASVTYSRARLLAARKE